MSSCLANSRRTSSATRFERPRSKQALAGAFEVLIDGDKNLEFQQNLKVSGLFVVVLVAPSNKLEDLLPRVPRALEAIARAKPGEIERVSRSYGTGTVV